MADRDYIRKGDPEFNQLVRLAIAAKADTVVFCGSTYRAIQDPDEPGGWRFVRDSSAGIDSMLGSRSV